jgi:hypothetical protein
VQAAIHFEVQSVQKKERGKSVREVVLPPLVTTLRVLGWLALLVIGFGGCSWLGNLLGLFQSNPNPSIWLVIGGIIWMLLYIFLLPRVIGGLGEKLDVGVGVAVVFCALGALIGWFLGGQIGSLDTGGIIGGIIGCIVGIVVIKRRS